MYLDMPPTPDAFCSVHSNVMVKRTSFFLDAAITWRDPREGAATEVWCDTRPDCTLEESTAGRAEVTENAMVFAAVEVGRRAAVCARYGVGLASSSSLFPGDVSKNHCSFGAPPPRVSDCVSRVGTTGTDATARTHENARRYGA